MMRGSDFSSPLVARR